MADSEDWNAEIQRNPENTFSLCAFQIQSDRQPKTAVLRYVRVTHCTDAAIRVRNQLDSHKITKQNFQQFKNRSFATEYKRRYELSPPLTRRNC